MSERPAPLADVPPLYRLEGLSKVYGVASSAVHALRGVDLVIAGGELIVLLGPSGSGKSTLLNIVGGLDRASGGHAWFGNVDLTECDDDELTEYRRRHVGFVFQNPEHQIVYPIVQEDLEFGLKNLRLPVSVMRERIDEVLDRLEIVHLRDRFTHQLSGGELQLVALAGVLVMKPSMIVFDEPTTLLDLRNTNLLMKVVSGLEQHVVMVSHDLALLRDFDRVLHFDEGRLVGDGQPGPIIDDYVARSLA